MSALVFNSELHEYRYEGVVVPSVTQLLRPIVDYSGIPESVLNHKRDIGIAAHAATELIDEQDLDYESLDPSVVGYANAYEKFLSENDVVWTESELRLYHPKLRYAGTVDRSGFVNKELAVVDIKCVSEIKPATGVQTAGYADLLMPGEGHKFKRYALQLKPDGSYRFVPFKSPADWACFAGLLAVHNWRIANE